MKARSTGLTHFNRFAVGRMPLLCAALRKGSLSFPTAPAHTKGVEKPLGIRRSKVFIIFPDKYYYVDFTAGLKDSASRGHTAAGINVFFALQPVNIDPFYAGRLSLIFITD